MAVIQTPIGVLETSIPTIYGEKSQFRTFDGNVFDIPDWLGWMGLVSGLLVGGYVGYQTCNIIASSEFYRGYVKEFIDTVTPAGEIKEAAQMLGFGVKKKGRKKK
jgi:hypothetical protein